MKILSAVCVVTLGIGSAAQAVFSSYCLTPPKGEYQGKCKDIQIHSYKDDHGVSKCKLSATCQLPPEQRSGWVASTLDLDEKEFGPNSSCTIVLTQGKLTCEKKEEI